MKIMFWEFISPWSVVILTFYFERITNKLITSRCTSSDPGVHLKLKDVVNCFVQDYHSIFEDEAKSAANDDKQNMSAKSSARVCYQVGDLEIIFVPCLFNYIFLLTFESYKFSYKIIKGMYVKLSWDFLYNTSKLNLIGH